MTASDFRFIVTEQLSAAGIDPGAIVIEPEPRNTGPAVLAAAAHLAASDPDALILAAPSDHAMADAETFRAAVAKGVEAARTGRIVTVGIAPTRAETGFGWLELDNCPNGEAQPLTRFVEKPDAENAARMLAAGNCLWNAGIFLFAARTMLEAAAAHASDLPAPETEALSRARPDLGFLRLDPEAWAHARDASLDYAVMERATNLSVVPFSGGRTDLGGWDAVWHEMGPDAAGVVASGNATAIDYTDALLRSEAEGLEVVGIGLRDIVAVAMPDAVLVADRSRAQGVRAAVSALESRGARQAESFPREHRPWGWFETLVLGDRFRVKCIVVHPGAALSLQSHVHRANTGSSCSAPRG